MAMASSPLARKSAFRKDEKPSSTTMPPKAERSMPGLGQGQAQGRGQTDGSQESRPALASLGDEQVHQQEHAGPGDQDDERENCVSDRIAS